jgi:hypothetical protein
MSRLLFSCLAIAILAGSELLLARAAVQIPLPGALRIRESKPVTVNDATFTAVAQTQWAPPKPNRDYPVIAPLDLQMRITNLRKNAVVFPTSHTFGIKLLTEAGKEIKPRSGRKGAAVTRPVLIPGGASYSLCRLAGLRWDEKARVSELVYYDGSGSQTIIGPLAPGRYKLAFWYAAAFDKREKQKGSSVATWAGEAVTGEVLVEVVAETTRGSSEKWQVERYFPQVATCSPKGVDEILRVRESKPVTVKGARFVVVAESDWKSGKTGVPIDLQLRITNLGKADMIFLTFDTFGVSMINDDGKRILPTGGRNLTIFTRPILIPKGASYSLCRKAELRWDANTRSNKLIYWDGTGMEDYYGPLPPGTYKLEFYYGASPDETVFKFWAAQHKRAESPPVWFGEAVTKQVHIEVRNP